MSKTINNLSNNIKKAEAAGRTVAAAKLKVTVNLKNRIRALEKRQRATKRFIRNPFSNSGMLQSVLMGADLDNAFHLSEFYEALNILRNKKPSHNAGIKGISDLRMLFRKKYDALETLINAARKPNNKKYIEPVQASIAASI